MATVTFTSALQRHVDCPTSAASGATVREVLDSVFHDNAPVRGYVLDDEGALRPHMVVFVDGNPVRDRRTLTDAVQPGSEIYVLQALSGG